MSDASLLLRVKMTRKSLQPPRSPPVTVKNLVLTQRNILDDGKNRPNCASNIRYGFSNRLCGFLGEIMLRLRGAKPLGGCVLVQRVMRADSPELLIGVETRDAEAIKCKGRSVVKLTPSLR